MSAGAQVDYDALAKQYGASSSVAPSSGAPIDYDALAKQHGATSSVAPSAPEVPWWRKMLASRPVPQATNEQIAASPVPGSFEGHPENIGEYVPASAGQIATGAQDIASGNVSKGGHEVLSGAGNAMLPVAPFLVAGSPVAATLRTAAGAAAGGGLAKTGAQALNATPEQEQLATDIGGIVGGGLANKIGGALPSTERAGAALEDVRASAGDIPIDTSKPGNTALELYEQSRRGAVLPKAVRQFVMRATDPKAEPITYAEAKDFQSNISSLSVNERMSLKPNTARLVGQLNADLKASLESAADTAGKGAQFTQAMQEYHRAMKLKGYTDKAIDAAIKTALTATGVIGLKKVFGTE